MILDVNVLLYAIDSQAVQHQKCVAFLERVLNETTRVGFPWPTLLGFLRIATHPRVMQKPLTVDEAWQFIDEWLAAPVAWIPVPAAGHAAVLRQLTSTLALTGNLVPDAHLAAVAIEQGVPLVSCDTDFARFTEIVWLNPLTAR